MLELTERALELLVPIIGDRMKLMSKLKKFKDECKSAVDNEPDIIVCSPLRESNSLNKNPTAVNQSKIRYRYLNIIHMFSVYVHVTVFDHAINLSGHTCILSLHILFQSNLVSHQYSICCLPNTFFSILITQSKILLYMEARLAHLARVPGISRSD